MHWNNSAFLFQGTIVWLLLCGNCFWVWLKFPFISKFHIGFETQLVLPWLSSKLLATWAELEISGAKLALWLWLPMVQLQFHVAGGGLCLNWYETQCWLLWCLCTIIYVYWARKWVLLVSSHFPQPTLSYLCDPIRHFQYARISFWRRLVGADGYIHGNGNGKASGKCKALVISLQSWWKEN